MGLAGEGKEIQALGVMQSANKSLLSSYCVPAFLPAEDTAVNHIDDTAAVKSTF